MSDILLHKVDISILCPYNVRTQTAKAIAMDTSFGNVARVYSGPPLSYIEAFEKAKSIGDMRYIYNKVMKDPMKSVNENHLCISTGNRARARIVFFGKYQLTSLSKTV